MGGREGARMCGRLARGLAGRMVKLAGFRMVKLAGWPTGRQAPGSAGWLEGCLPAWHTDASQPSNQTMIMKMMIMMLIMTMVIRIQA